ncbi:YiiX/YebB-like N1pC/P60 family cysteine hydrolase [Pseudomonas brassicacearum]|uniref:YiiX/YebB-like N1pC/P60 family cysteine hydrolase n=1 Tax=Pseudomonas brassicacearum TaxID=930166 RepID=UPI0002D5654B|nr:YiiX/YebB-like N1pC/P60 family cysteine hydrolase [Pseudomonas brassicacearum]ROM90619.1 hypothetical protein BK656_23995 [Pseudomonas brassicacearum]
MKTESKLSEANELYILDFSKLEIGDVILTRTNELQSKVIRSVTNGEFSHALLYVEHASCIHATKHGVHSLNIQRLLFESDSDVAILRLNPEHQASQQTLKDICDHTRKKIAVRYDKKNAIKAGLAHRNPGIKADPASELQFCSQLIYEAYASQNINISPKGRFCTPADIEDSEILHRISCPTLLATAAEKKFSLDETRDKIKIQTKATNFIFSKARKNISRDINTFEDLYQHAVNDRKADLKISKILKESKYLDMAKYELEDCPWRYNHNAFKALQLPIQEELQVIENEINGAIRQIKKYESAVHQYENLYIKFKSTSIKYTLTAYSNMLAISHVRYNLFTNLRENLRT